MENKVVSMWYLCLSCLCPSCDIIWSILGIQVNFLNSFPSQSNQGGPQPQSMFHSGGLSAPTPPNLPPGHSSPQASYTMQGYSLPTHQPLPHGFPSISQLTQVNMNLFTTKGELHYFPMFLSVAYWNNIFWNWSGIERTCCSQKQWKTTAT